MKYSILRHIRCPNIYHRNFKGTHTYTSMEELANTLVSESVWDSEITKSELPLVCMTTFNHYIRADSANSTILYALDFDDEGNDINRVLQIFDGYSFFLYTSYSHTEEHHKFRLILKLDTEVMNNMESHLVFSIFNELLIPYGIMLDQQCKDISRRFYLPAYDKNGEIPTMVYNEGKDFEIEEKLTQKLRIKLHEEEQREIKLKLSKVNKIKSDNGSLKERKIEEAQQEFLSFPSHSALGKVIGSLRFWGMDHTEVDNWCMMNYNPSTGKCEYEVRNWSKWWDRKNSLTFDEKY